jgi:toxin YoeB
MSRMLAQTNDACDDYSCWQGQNKKTLKRINKLITDTKRSSFECIGKPKPLIEYLADFWPHSIDDTNRLVYAVNETHLTIISWRYHY